MTLPVSTPEFWKERIARAVKEGLYHYSVYLIDKPRWERIAQMHKEILQRECPGMKVLDAGCGYGRASEWFDDDKYQGVDISPDFIHEAKKRYPSKQFTNASLDHLPYPARTFDIAFCISIKGMIKSNLGDEAWQDIENELRRVADKVLILEYEESDTYFII